MSLRARLLLAFAYVLVLVIVALEVPLALNLSKRVDAEIRSEAQGQAQLLAAGASGRLDDREQLEPLVESSAEDLGGRVIVVDENGGLLADSERRGRAGCLDSEPPRGRRRAAGPRLAGRAPKRVSSTRTCCSRRCRSWSRAGRRGPCASPREWTPSRPRCETT